MGGDDRGLRISGELRSTAERATMPVGERLHGIAEIAQQMPAIRNLDGVGCALSGTVGVGAGAIARDEGHARVLPQPHRQGLGLTVGKQIHHAVALQVDQDRAERWPRRQAQSSTASTRGGG